MLDIVFFLIALCFLPGGVILLFSNWSIRSDIRTNYGPIPFIIGCLCMVFAEIAEYLNW